MEQPFTTSNEQCKHVFPNNFYQLQEALFDKLDFSVIPHTEDQKSFKNLATFDFQSISVQEDKICNTDTTTWIGKHTPIYV